MNKNCKKCGKSIHYATVCPYCGTVQLKFYEKNGVLYSEVNDMPVSPDVLAECGIEVTDAQRRSHNNYARAMLDEDIGW